MSRACGGRVTEHVAARPKEGGVALALARGGGAGSVASASGVAGAKHGAVVGKVVGSAGTGAVNRARSVAAAGALHGAESATVAPKVVHVAATAAIITARAWKRRATTTKKKEKKRKKGIGREGSAVGDKKKSLCRKEDPKKNETDKPCMEQVVSGSHATVQLVPKKPSSHRHWPVAGSQEP